MVLETFGIARRDLAGDVGWEFDDRGLRLGRAAIHCAQNAAYRDISRIDAEDHCGNYGGEHDGAEDQVIQSC